MFSLRLENGYGDVTSLVCFGAFHEASCELEKAQLRYRIAAHALTTVREKLDEAVGIAYQQQSFGPLKNLFAEEEAALAVYERAVARLAQAEERWCALWVALAYEKELMRAGPLLCKRLN